MAGRRRSEGSIGNSRAVRERRPIRRSPRHASLRPPPGSHGRRSSARLAIAPAWRQGQSCAPHGVRHDDRGATDPPAQARGGGGKELRGAAPRARQGARPGGRRPAGFPRSSSAFGSVQTGRFPSRRSALALATPGLADGQGRRREARLRPNRKDYSHDCPI